MKRLTGKGTIYRNSPLLPELRATFRSARVYSEKAGRLVPCDADQAWRQLDDNPQAVLTLDAAYGQVLTIYPGRGYSKVFWELRQDDPRGTFLDWLEGLSVEYRQQLRADLDRLAHEPWGDEW